MKARHRAKEVDAGDALDCRVDRGKGIDQADRDVVAVDIEAFDGRLASWSGDARGRRTLRIDQGRREARGAALVRTAHSWHARAVEIDKVLRACVAASAT